MPHENSQNRAESERLGDTGMVAKPFPPATGDNCFCEAATIVAMSHWRDSSMLPSGVWLRLAWLRKTVTLVGKIGRRHLRADR